MPILPSLATISARPSGRAARAFGCAVALVAALFCAAPGAAAAGPQLAEADGPIARMVAGVEVKNTFFRIVFEDHPAERQAYIRALRSAYRRGGEPALSLMSLRFGEYIGRKYFRYYFSRTSDAAALGYVRFVADTLMLLRLGSHDDCYGFVAGTTRERARVLDVMNAEEKRRMLDVLAGIVLGSRKAKPRKPGPGPYQVPLAAVRARVAERLGRENVIPWKPGLVGHDRARACEHALAFFEEILKQPAREGALVARAVLGGAARPTQTSEH